jgi:hypothetical protein
MSWFHQFRRHFFLLIYWQLNYKLSKFSHLSFNRYTPTVSFYDVVAQAKSRSD